MAMIALAVGVVSALVVRSRGDDLETQERDFCRRVLAKGSVGGGTTNRSLKECASDLQQAMLRNREVRQSTVDAYGRRVAKDSRKMPGPVRAAVAEALARHPGEVFESLAWGSGRSPAKEPKLMRESLVHVLNAIARDDSAWRVLRKSQQDHIKNRIDELKRSDFARSPRKGEVDRAIVIGNQTGRVVGSLARIKIHTFGSGDDKRAQRISEYERHGFPWLRRLLYDRAHAVGILESTMKDTGSRLSDIVHEANVASALN
ncbi:hypothetical protein [Streptomyces sp. NPDC006925]|uniref:hypothetical protein n=1 Tax=Streptomyces sp. NPDC006925 TaxID=3364768 RepID=UPI0036744E61